MGKAQIFLVLKKNNFIEFSSFAFLYNVQRMHEHDKGYYRLFPLPILYATKLDPYSHGLFQGLGGIWDLKVSNDIQHIDFKPNTLCADWLPSTTATYMGNENIE